MGTAGIDKLLIYENWINNKDDYNRLHSHLLLIGDLHTINTIRIAITGCY